MAKTEIKATDSRFTGGAFANFFIGFFTGLLSIVTLGLAYPALVCWKLRWKAKHTYIDGCRLVFDGKAIQLFGKYILWFFLSIITIGIYAMIAMPLNMKKWETVHTHFEGVQGGESKFDGKVIGLFGVNFLTGFVTLITLSFGSYWAHCYRERWYKKHTVIDGCRLFFDGKAGQYFGKSFVWALLTIVTVGVYSFWLVVNQEKWTVYHTHAENLPDTVDLESLKMEEVEEQLIVPKGIEEKAKNQGRASIILGLMPLVLCLSACLLGVISAEHYDFHTITKADVRDYYKSYYDIDSFIASNSVYIRENGIWYCCEDCTKNFVVCQWIDVFLIILSVIVAFVGVVLSLLNFKINRVHHKKISLGSIIINSVMFIICDPLIVITLIDCYYATFRG